MLGSQVERFFRLLGFLEMLFFQVRETVTTRLDSKKVRKQKLKIYILMITNYK